MSMSSRCESCGHTIAANCRICPTCSMTFGQDAMDRYDESRSDRFGDSIEPEPTYECHTGWDDYSEESMGPITSDDR